MTNRFTEGLNEEQMERYLTIKDMCLRNYPDVMKSKVQMELSEHLWRYYAIHNKVPDPPTEKGEPEERIFEYKTPKDIELTLQKVDDIDIQNLVIEDVKDLPDNFIEI